MGTPWWIKPGMSNVVAFLIKQNSKLGTLDMQTVPKC